MEGKVRMTLVGGQIVYSSNNNHHRRRMVWLRKTALVLAPAARDSDLARCCFRWLGVRSREWVHVRRWSAPAAADLRDTSLARLSETCFRISWWLSGCARGIQPHLVAGHLRHP
ncbi:hypothetical protein ACTMU2_39085 [Cupriavidus basilensis]